jgi:WD40 repeat protein
MGMVANAGGMDDALLCVLEGHTRPVLSVAFSPNGQALASGSEDKTIRAWQVTDGAFLYVLGEHANPVESIAFPPMVKRWPRRVAAPYGCGRPRVAYPRAP